MIALVGTDGARPVVWGLGATSADARDDAQRWLAEAERAGELDGLEEHEVSDEQAAVVRAGDVSWPIITPEVT